jgi:hypothetical protein
MTQLLIGLEFIRHDKKELNWDFSIKEIEENLLKYKNKFTQVEL